MKKKCVVKPIRKERISSEPDKFQNETEILSRVIQYEQELGCQPGLLDLALRFSHEELDAVWDSLVWLYPDFDKKGPAKIHSELVMT